MPARGDVVGVRDRLSGIARPLVYPVAVPMAPAVFWAAPTTPFPTRHQT